ncbi:hypothetical protein [Streptomyces sp. NPDC048650]|uniref:hypothetical protein n=1 Tax=unclassified Streptomyces TaxID=2593676 RepID=UPI003715348E
MTARRSRRSAAYAALALGLAGSLALTGCNSHSSKKSKKHSYSSSSKSKKRRIIGGTGAAAGAGAAASRTRPCTVPPGSFKLTAAGASGPSHVIVRYHNIRSASCYLYNAPMLFFPDSKKEEGYDRTKPLGFYEGGPGFLNGHRIEVKGDGYAYASVPTKTASDKGTRQSMMYLGAMAPSQIKVRSTATPRRFGQYKSMWPSLGKTAKVSDWYLDQHTAETQSDTALSDK